MHCLRSKLYMNTLGDSSSDYFCNEVKVSVLKLCCFYGETSNVTSSSAFNIDVTFECSVG